MQLLIAWPMVLVLSIKFRLLRIFLSMAKEQTRDAMNKACNSCFQAENRCERPYKCRIQRLKDREKLMIESLKNTEERIARIASA